MWDLSGKKCQENQDYENQNIMVKYKHLKE